MLEIVVSMTSDVRRGELRLLEVLDIIKPYDDFLV